MQKLDIQGSIRAAAVDCEQWLDNPLLQQIDYKCTLKPHYNGRLWTQKLVAVVEGWLLYRGANVSLRA